MTINDVLRFTTHFFLLHRYIGYKKRKFLENFRAFVWEIPERILDDFSGIM